MNARNTLSAGCAIALILAGIGLAAAAPSQVGIHIFKFRPGELEVRAGTRVTWTNQDEITHTVTSGTPERRDGRFDERLEGRGAAASVQFTNPGVYPYFCGRHPSMCAAKSASTDPNPTQEEQNMLTTTMVKSVCALASVALLATACAKPMASPMSGGEGRMAASSATPAATLRVALNGLLGEHVILAAAATGAALDGRDAEFKAAAGALDANSVDLAKAIGSVYGKDAEQAFLPLWRRHIGFAVDYTIGVATKDGPKQQKAVSDLIAYTDDFGAFLSAANPNLPKAVVANLVKHHVVTLKQVVDAQASKDYARAYTAQREAVDHMQMIADPLAAAIVKQFPDKFAGSSDTPAAGLRTVLNLDLREHAYLAGAATNAALGGRDAEFKAAAGALDTNSVDLAKAIGSIYGQDAEEAFLPLWRRHIGFFVDYTVGVATKDRAKQDKAVSELISYTQDFGAFLQSANPNLPKQVVADLVKHHVVTLKGVVDAQAAKDHAKAYSAVRAAAGHMQMIADPLTLAIVKQFPDRFTASAK